MSSGSSVENKYLSFSRTYLATSSIRGFPRIVRAQSRTSCLIWSVVVIVLGVIGSIQLYEVISEFTKWEITQDVRDVRTSETYFPSITMCNLQPLNSEMHVELITQYIDFVKKLQQKHRDSDFSNMLSYSGLFQNLNHDEINQMSHRLETFIQDCKIQYYLNERVTELPCDKSRIERLPHPDYFNCFILHPENVKDNLTVKSIMDSTNNSSLFIKSVHLILYLDDFSYPIFPPEFTADAGTKQGIRLAIQPHMEYPDLENGLEITPGVFATFQLSTKKHHYLTPPYGKCENIDREDIHCSDPTSLDDTKLVYKYNREVCRKLCLQKEIFDECGCLDPTLPIPADISVFRQSFLPEIKYLNKRSEKVLYRLQKNMKRSGEGFDCRNISIYASTQSRAGLYCLKWTNFFGKSCSLPSFRFRKTCWTEMYRSQESITKCDRSNCTHTCSMMEYNYKHTMSRWPHESYHLAFYEKFIKPNPLMRDKFHAYETIKKELKRNLTKVYEMLENTNLITRRFVKLHFHMKSPKITVIKDIEQFPVFRLLSSIGGALNLWIGITVVAFVELFELLLNLLIIFIDGKKSNRVADANGNEEKPINETNHSDYKSL